MIERELMKRVRRKNKRERKIMVERERRKNERKW